MRNFLVLANNVRTDANWTLNSLPNAGRMDLLARCVNSAFWLSDTLRKDVVFYTILGGEPNAPVCVKFIGSELRSMTPDERNIASSFKELLSLPLSQEWKTNKRGGYICKKGFEEILKELEAQVKPENTYWLTAGGAPLESFEGKEFNEALFILGDAIGPSKEQKKELRSYNKLSLGTKEYLASHCIVVLNYLLDGSETQ